MLAHPRGLATRRFSADPPLRELIARIDNDHYVPHLVEGSALAPSGWFS